MTPRVVFVFLLFCIFGSRADYHVGDEPEEKRANPYYMSQGREEEQREMSFEWLTKKSSYSDGIRAGHNPYKEKGRCLKGQIMLLALIGDQLELPR